MRYRKVAVLWTVREALNSRLLNPIALQMKRRVYCLAILRISSMPPHALLLPYPSWGHALTLSFSARRVQTPHRFLCSWSSHELVDPNSYLVELNVFPSISSFSASRLHAFVSS